MSNFKTRLASGLAAAALAAGLAAAQGLPGLAPPASPAAPANVQVEILNNASKGFQIGYPAGWQVIAGANEVDYGFLSPDQNAMCVVVSLAVPDLAGVPEDQLRAAMSVPQGEEFWNQNFFNQFQNVKYQHVGANTKHPGGWPLQTVQASGDISENGKTLGLTFAGIFTAKSGSLFRTMCYTPTALFEQNKAQFFAVFESFKITK
ncbi:MAG: hypothetical protein QM698_00055 [Micropepsaceae bacterium]